MTQEMCNKIVHTHSSPTQFVPQIIIVKRKINTNNVASQKMVEFRMSEDEKKEIEPIFNE